MTNWVKKITYSGLVIIIALAVDYVNNMYFHNMMISLLNYVYSVGPLILIIGVLWNDEQKKIIQQDDKLVEQRIREKIDAKIMIEQMNVNKYLKEQYIHNEVDNL